MGDKIMGVSGGISPRSVGEVRMGSAPRAEDHDIFQTTGKHATISDAQLMSAGDDERMAWAAQRVGGRFAHRGIDMETIPHGTKDAIIRTIANCTTCFGFRVINWDDMAPLEMFGVLFPLVKDLKEKRSVMRINVFVDHLAEELKTSGGTPSPGGGGNGLGFDHDLRAKLAELYPDLLHRGRSIVAMAMPAMRSQIDYGVSATCLAGMFVGAGQTLAVQVMSMPWSTGVTTFLGFGI